MPGFMERLRLCQRSYNSTSNGIGEDAGFLPNTVLSGNRQKMSPGTLYTIYQLGGLGGRRAEGEVA